MDLQALSARRVESQARTRLPGPFIRLRFPGGLPWAPEDAPAFWMSFILRSGKGFPFSPGTESFAPAGAATLPSVAHRLACRSPASKAPRRAESGAGTAAAEGKELRQEEALPEPTTGFSSSFPVGRLRSQPPGAKPAVPRPSPARKRCAGGQRRPDHVTPCPRAGPGPDRPQRSGAGGMTWFLPICRSKIGRARDKRRLQLQITQQMSHPHEISSFKTRI